MDDLVEWLRLQLDEDERVASIAPHDLPGALVAGLKLAALDEERNPSDAAGAAGALRWASEYVAEECKRWSLHDPARVLREVEAARRRIDGCAAEIGHITQRVSQGLPSHGMTAAFAALMLKLEALPYSDRPGFREEWKP